MGECELCGSPSCVGECRYEPFCEHCGSMDCRGQCLKCPLCGKKTCDCPKEAPGASLARKAQEVQEEVSRGVLRAAKDQIFPYKKPLPKCTPEEFAERLASKRPKFRVAVRRDGTQYRKKV
jgi:hypothetical protein